MGRNAIPKVGEWRDGALYSVDRPEKGKNGYCTLKRTTKDGEEYLANFWPDGEDESLFCAWFAGFEKGKKAGYEAAQRDMRKALGVSEPNT